MWKVKLAHRKDILYRAYRTNTICGPYTPSIFSALNYMRKLDFGGSTKAEKVELILPTELL